MNGYYDEYDDVSLEDIGDDDAFSEFFEDDGALDVERGGRQRSSSRRRPPPAQARGGGYNQPRPSSQYVTQVQLQALATRIGNDIKKLNEADKTINARVNALDTRLNARLDRHALVIKKERRARIKADAEQKNTLLLITAAALFLKPKTGKVTVKNAEGDDEEANVLLEEKSDSLKAFVPIGIALLGGQLGGLLGGGGLESGGGSGNSGL